MSASFNETVADLIAGLAVAMGADVNLDARIGSHFRIGPGSDGGPLWVREWEGAFVPHPTIAGSIALEHSDGKTGMHWKAAQYTGSVDAALCLAEEVLPGVWWIFGKGKTRPDEPIYGAQMLFDTQVLGEGEHNANLPLAICIAILRAGDWA